MAPQRTRLWSAGRKWMSRAGNLLEDGDDSAVHEPGAAEESFEGSGERSEENVA
eukprot:COSAG02_NODE_30226_length_555_cov_0.785088_1_plen_53_part_01